VWIYTGNKLAQFHGTIFSLSENVAKSFKGATFLTHTVDSAREATVRRRRFMHRTSAVCSRHTCEADRSLSRTVMSRWSAVIF